MAYHGQLARRRGAIGFAVRVAAGWRCGCEKAWRRVAVNIAAALKIFAKAARRRQRSAKANASYRVNAGYAARMAAAARHGGAPAINMRGAALLRLAAWR